MSHPTKKQKIDDHQRNDVVATVLASFDGLSIDVLSNIFAFLPVDDIMRSRRINKKTREAVRKTIVPLTNFRVGSVKRYNAMNMMTTELPNLQGLSLGRLDLEHKYSEGEDPPVRAVRTARYTTHDIEIISNFSKLRYLSIYHPLLNGRYPVLFSSFPLLQILSITDCKYLKWDLEMLAGFPLLKELDCLNNFSLTGNINRLRVLKDTLEKVEIRSCENVEGNLMDMADFPHLKELKLNGTAVTGDIRYISEHDFSSLECLILPKGVYGGRDYELQRISDAPEVVRAVYLFNKHRPALSIKYWYGNLSKDSPDWYESVEEDEVSPPFDISLVQAGSRIGYRWESFNGDHPCEVNWLDPEPSRESSDYGKYTEELQGINSHVNMYRGFHQPPTEEEYNRLCEEYNEESPLADESDLDE